MSRPIRVTAPAVGGISRRTARARVDLPEPLSPTIPRVKHRGVGGHGRQRRAAAAVDPVEARDRRQQRAGVVGLRRGEDRLHVAFFDIGAVLHHADPVGQPGDDPHVVGDQHHGRAGLALQLGHQVEDLGLDGHVQRRGRLVGDQQLRTAGHRRGDHHPLAHAAGELVRVLAQAARRVGDAHVLQPFPGALHRVVAGEPVMQAQRLGDLLADAHMRGERGQRVLEDHRHLRAADAVQRPRPQAQELGPQELRRARGAAVGRQEAHHGHEGLALAGAAFADDPEGLAARDGEGDAADGVDDPVVGGEVDPQVLDRKNRFGQGRLAVGRRRP
jgi:hypothetical protein